MSNRESRALSTLRCRDLAMSASRGIRSARHWQEALPPACRDRLRRGSAISFAAWRCYLLKRRAPLLHYRPLAGIRDAEALCREESTVPPVSADCERRAEHRTPKSVGLTTGVHAQFYADRRVWFTGILRR